MIQHVLFTECNHMRSVVFLFLLTLELCVHLNSISGVNGRTWELTSIGGVFTGESVYSPACVTSRPLSEPMVALNRITHDAS